jgi:hypothetical protein
VFVLLGGSTSQSNQTPNIGVPGDNQSLLTHCRIRFATFGSNWTPRGRRVPKSAGDTTRSWLSSPVGYRQSKRPRRPRQRRQKRPRRSSSSRVGASPTPLQEERRRAHSVGPGGVGCYSGAGDGQRELGVHGPVGELLLMEAVGRMRLPRAVGSRLSVAVSLLVSHTFSLPPRLSCCAGYQPLRVLPPIAPRRGEPAPSRNPKSYQFPLLAAL